MFHLEEPPDADDLLVFRGQIADMKKAVFSVGIIHHSPDKSRELRLMFSFQTYAVVASIQDI